MTLYRKTTHGKIEEVVWEGQSKQSLRIDYKFRILRSPKAGSDGREEQEVSEEHTRLGESTEVNSKETSSVSLDTKR